MRTLVVESPLGPVSIVAEDGALTGLYLHARAPSRPSDGDDPLLSEARGQLAAYFAGSRRSFDLPLAPRGTAFQREVWGALRAVPFGETISYAELARRIGRPGAARAVGAANARNPISIIVPCHRVIGADGTLTGYAGGLEAKAWLLDHERRRSAESRAEKSPGGAASSAMRAPVLG